MDKRFMPYILPIITLVVILIVGFTVPGIRNGMTGYAIKETEDIIIRINVFTDSKGVIPKDSIIEVSLGGKTSSMTMQEFIEKTGMSYEFKEGTYSEMNYGGWGYAGNFTYTLDLEEFNLEQVPTKEQQIKTKLYYKDYILSESNQTKR